MASIGKRKRSRESQIASPSAPPVKRKKAHPPAHDLETLKIFEDAERSELASLESEELLDKELWFFQLPRNVRITITWGDRGVYAQTP